MLVFVALLARPGGVYAIDSILVRVDGAISVIGSLNGEHGRESCTYEGDMITVGRMKGSLNGELRIRRRSLDQAVDDTLRQGRAFE
jgi:hypothetical protein